MKRWIASGPRLLLQILLMGVWLVAAAFFAIVAVSVARTSSPRAAIADLRAAAITASRRAVSDRPTWRIGQGALAHAVLVVTQL